MAPASASDLALPRRPQDSVPACLLRLWPGKTFTHKSSSAFPNALRQVQQYGHGDWGVGRNPLVSVAAVAAGWVDRLQLLKVELGNRLQLLRQAGSFEIGREVIQPCSVFVLQIDERRYRCRPPPGPRRDARGRRWRGCAAV